MRRDRARDGAACRMPRHPGRDRQRPLPSSWTGEELSMATASTAPPVLETLADLLEKLGDVPLDRIRLQPPPGTATEEDVIAARNAPERRLCELVEGVLV